MLAISLIFCIGANTQETRTGGLLRQDQSPPACCHLVDRPPHGGISPDRPRGPPTPHQVDTPSMLRHHLSCRREPAKVHPKEQHRRGRRLVARRRPVSLGLNGS